MTYEQRRALRLLISEARRQQVAQAHQHRHTCDWCREDYEPTVPNRRYCTSTCASKAAWHQKKRKMAVA